MRAVLIIATTNTIPGRERAVRGGELQADKAVERQHHAQHQVRGLRQALHPGWRRQGQPDQLQG